MEAASQAETAPSSTRESGEGNGASGCWRFEFRGHKSGSGWAHMHRRRRRRRLMTWLSTRRPASSVKLNLPEMLPSCYVRQQREMSPRSVQAAASNAGMAVDARRIVEAEEKNEKTDEHRGNRDMNDGFWWDWNGDGGGGADGHLWQGIAGGYTQGEALSISIDDYLLDLQHSWKFWGS